MSPRMLRILDPVRVEHIDGRRWKLLDTFRYYLGGPRGPEWVEVPAGFLTDFASVPRLLQWLIPPTGPYSPAALVHDKLYFDPIVRSTYGARSVQRDEADQIFKEAMVVVGIGWWSYTTLYLGVRVGGWQTWDRYRRGEVMRFDDDAA